MALTIDYNGNTYLPRSEKDQITGFVVASAVSGLILSPLKLTSKPFRKQLEKSYSDNHIYKTKLYDALKLSGLEDKGVKIIEAQNEANKLSPEALGLNAYYNFQNREVCINTDKISIAGFHELGHALNNLSKHIPTKALSKYYTIGYSIAGLMEYFAIFSRKKPKEADSSITDIIENNCGKIAFLAMTPIVAEEALASHKGIKLAEKLELDKRLIKNMKNLYKKALMTYAGRAVLGGLAVGASRMIMDYYTRPKEITSPIFDFFG